MRTTRLRRRGPVGRGIDDRGCHADLVLDHAAHVAAVRQHQAGGLQPLAVCAQVAANRRARKLTPPGQTLEAGAGARERVAVVELRGAEHAVAVGPDDHRELATRGDLDAAVQQTVLGHDQVGRVLVEKRVENRAPLAVPAQRVAIAIAQESRLAQRVRVHAHEAVVVAGASGPAL